MKTYLKNFAFGILAGIAIGFGGFLNLLCLNENLKFLGSVLFSVGLLSVCFFKLHLYTGKIGYVKENNINYFVSLFLMLIGNTIGAVGLGYLLRLTPCANYASVSSVASKKIIFFNSDCVYKTLRMLCLSFLCGTFVFVGVDIFKKYKNYFVKIIGIIFAVTVFVFTGMEHCIADIFYFSFANSWKDAFGQCFYTIIIAIIGNSIGAIVFYDLRKVK